MIARLCAMGLVVGFAIPASAQVLADSIADFSGVQGQAGWHYGYYSGDLTTDSFQEMPSFDGVRWWVQQPNYWTMLGAVGAHPNGPVTSSPAQSVEQWPARRWVSSTYEGEVVIDLTLLKINTSPVGDGVTGRLFVDGLEIWNRYVQGTDGQGVTLQLTAPVVIGTTIDFVVDPDGNDWADATRLSGVISVPTPGALTLVTLGGVVLCRRSRRR